MISQPVLPQFRQVSLVPKSYKPCQNRVALGWYEAQRVVVGLPCPDPAARLGHCDAQ